MKKIKFIISLVLLFVGIGLVNAQDIPDRPNPPRLVNDYAGLLSTEQQNMLERKLVNFNDSTSTQIAVVIVKSLNGYEAADYAQRLGEKWGVGQKGKNNGLVFLISPSEKKVFLAPGYGLEAVIPDATCKLIIENEIKPYFKQNDFNTGINKAVTVLMSLAKKDYPASAYNKKHENKKGSGLAGFIFIIFIIIIIFVSKVMAGKKSHLTAGGKVPFWTLFWLMMMSNNGRSGNWNDFSSGRGGFGGGSSGGFGGFGGGGFGGGGADGSW